MKNKYPSTWVRIPWACKLDPSTIQQLKDLSKRLNRSQARLVEDALVDTFGFTEPGENTAEDDSRE